MKKLLEYWEILTSILLIVALSAAHSTRLSAVEVNQKDDRATIKEMARDVSDIKTDVGYIRGKLEK